MLTLQKDEILDIEVETSTICQADCPLCFRNYKVFEKVYPKSIQRPIEDIINQLNEYPNLEWVRLVGSVSEPTIYKDFFKLCEYLKNRDVNIEICTNGDTHNPEWWKKLGKILDEQDRVFFTICGSNQELHETYRKGTNLKNILENAKALREVNPIDYAQCIRFDYNNDDFNSKEFKEVVGKFSNIYWTETFLKKSEDNYTNTKNLEKLKPNPKKIKSYLMIEKIADKRKLNSKADCKSLNDKSQIIDINGNVYPCYLFMEWMEGKKWDGDYQKIIDMKYEVCKFCEKGIVKMLENADLTYII